MPAALIAIRAFMVAAALTVLIECAVAALLGLRSRYQLTVIVLVNLITNPLLNLALLGVSLRFPGTAALIVALVVLEALVVLVEWRVFVWALTPEVRHPLLLAIGLNVASFVIGGFVMRLVPGIA